MIGERIHILENAYEPEIKIAEQKRIALLFGLLTVA